MTVPTRRVFAGTAVFAALALLAGCASAEEYRSRTSTDTARAAEPAREGAQAARAGQPAGMGARAKPYAYAAEAEGLFLGVDASQARLRAETKEAYLPIAVLIANRSKKDLALRDAGWSYRAGEAGEWSPLPTYGAVRARSLPESLARRELGRNDPFSLRFSVLSRILYSPYPGLGGGVRVESAGLHTMEYAHFLAWIPNPGLAAAGGGHYLRFADSEKNVELTVGFLIVEPKKR